MEHLTTETFKEKVFNYEKNKELVEALDGLSEFKKKFEKESPNFVTRVYNLGENARKTLKPISEHK